MTGLSEDIIKVLDYINWCPDQVPKPETAGGNAAMIGPKTFGESLTQRASENQMAPVPCVCPTCERRRVMDAAYLARKIAEASAEAAIRAAVEKGPQGP